MISVMHLCWFVLNEQIHATLRIQLTLTSWFFYGCKLTPLNNSDESLEKNWFVGESCSCAENFSSCHEVLKYKFSLHKNLRVWAKAVYRSLCNWLRLSYATFLWRGPTSLCWKQRLRAKRDAGTHINLTAFFWKVSQYVFPPWLFSNAFHTSV